MCLRQVVRRRSCDGSDGVAAPELAASPLLGAAPDDLAALLPAPTSSGPNEPATKQEDCGIPVFAKYCDHNSIKKGAQRPPHLAAELGVELLATSERFQVAAPTALRVVFQMLT